MIKSMTGFGRGESSDGKRNVVCEIRSVNHRYADIYIKLPKRYTFAEEAIKKEVRKIIKRGKVEVYLMIDNLTEEDFTIRLNSAAARQYYENLVAMKEEFHLQDEVTLELLAGMPDVLKTIPDVEDEEEVRDSILKAVRAAAENMDRMRCAEGEKLRRDLDMRGDLILELLEKIEIQAPEVGKQYAAKLKERIKELLGDTMEMPEDRILMEAAIFADKANITEEMVRLHSHIQQLHEILASDQTSGKKLDFLVQEMNREANTIGSKANDLGITSAVLEIKSEVEKIREQVQNIE